MKSLSGECHGTSLIRSQHWFKQWLGAVTDLCRRMASQGYSELQLKSHEISFRTKHRISNPCCHCQARKKFRSTHYDDVIMTMLASQITSLTVVYSIVHSSVNQRKHQSSASLAFVREIHRGPVNFPHKWPVTRKMFPFDDVIMWWKHVLKNKHLKCRVQNVGFFVQGSELTDGFSVSFRKSYIDYNLREHVCCFV